MRNFGDTADYRPSRNKDLMEAYKRNVESERIVRFSDIVEKTIHSPAKRFYIGERRAREVMAYLFKGGKLNGMRPERERMYKEIFDRCSAIMESGRAAPLQEIVREVIAQPAPEFYLTLGSAKVILHHIRHEG